MKKLLDILSVIMIAVALFLIITHFGRVVNPYNKRDTITIVSIDTVYDTIAITKTKLKEIERTVLRTDTIKADTVLTYEQKHFQDSLDLGKCNAVLDVFASGVDVALDSVKISAEIPTITKTIEKTIYQPQPKKFKDRLFIAPSVGVGYGLINHKADVYVGVSAGIKLF